MHFAKRFISGPLQRLIHDSRSVGVLLLVCTAASLLLSNLGAGQIGYRNSWMNSFDGTTGHYFHIGFLSLPNSPLLLINDGLMTLLFFLAGMEIKRELVMGELSSLKNASLPIGAAIGGMLMPAVLFALINKNTDGMQGWAIPTATDIAFTLGVASLLGKKVPAALKIFLTALAIIDDLGAIIVIAVFYGSQVQVLYLLACLFICVVCWLLNRTKISFGWMHWLLGIILWYCMFHSGIHPTVAGVVFAALIPAKLLTKLEQRFHVPVYFIVMPLFALANTAIAIPGNALQALNTPVSWGILAGLCIGKPLGIFLACYLMVKKKIAILPKQSSWYAMIGAGLLAGIGFTMSIFISTLAFTDPAQQDTAKIAVLLASFTAMLAGFVWLKLRQEPGRKGS